MEITGQWWLLTSKHMFPLYIEIASIMCVVTVDNIHPLRGSKSIHSDVGKYLADFKAILGNNYHSMISHYCATRCNVYLIPYAHTKHTRLAIGHLQVHWACILLLIKHIPRQERKGLGTLAPSLGSASSVIMWWFAQVCIEHVRSCDGVQDQGMFPDPFPLEAGVWEQD